MRRRNDFLEGLRSLASIEVNPAPKACFFSGLCLVNPSLVLFSVCFGVCVCRGLMLESPRVIFDVLMIIFGLETWSLWGDLAYFAYLALYLVVLGVKA